MKKIIYLFIIFSAFVMACEDREFLVSDVFVKFDQTATQAAEADAGGDNVFVPISITSTGDRSSDITVDIQLTGTAVAGVHYLLVSPTTLTIPADAYSVDVEIQLLQNNTTDGSVDLNIEIVSNSANLQIGFPGPDALNSVHTVTFVDDDCAFDISIFDGTYDVNEDNGAFLYTAEVTATGPNTIQVTNIWDFGMTVEVTLDATDPDNLRAFILPQDTGVELCCGADSWVTSRADINALPPVDASLADGSFSTCDGGFEIDFYVYIPGAGTFNGQQSINAVYTRQ